MNNMQIALEITALGMGLVFAAIILLWWMMTLLTSITADKEPALAKGTISDSANASATTRPSSVMDGDIQAQAAAVAVAMALAEQQVSSAHPLSDPPTAIVSAWQLGMRMRQLYQKGPIRRPRKLGDK